MNSEKELLESTITHLLQAVRDAHPGAMDALFERVYPDLKRLARHILDRRARGNRSISATTIVHGACARMIGGAVLAAEDRRHFFRLFCRAMEHEWVDRARRAMSIKRGGKKRRESLSAEITQPSPDTSAYLDLQEALTDLKQVDPDAAELVNLRYYCNATLEGAAEIMGCSFATARRNWTYAKSWLHRRLSDGEAPSSGNGPST